MGNVIAIPCNLFSWFTHIYTAGSSQAVNLTQNSDGITCHGETAVFTCTVSTPAVRWVAEPLVSRNRNPALFIGIPSAVGDVILRGPDDVIIMTLVSVNPMVTTMTVSGNLTEDLVVECEAVAGDGSTV